MFVIITIHQLSEGAYMSSSDIIDVILVEPNARISEVVMGALTAEDITCVVVGRFEGILNKKAKCLIIGTPVLHKRGAFVAALMKFREVARGPKVMLLVHGSVWSKDMVFRPLFDREYINLTPVMSGKTSGLIKKVRAVIGPASES